MNTQEYISSGILELYVMNTLGRKETAEVEQMANAYPEIKAEIELIESQMEEYAGAHAIQPSDSVKKSLFDKIDALEQVEINNTKKAGNFSAPIIPIGGRKNSSMYSIAASITFGLVSVGVAYNYHNKLQDANQQIIALQSDRTILASNIQTVNQKFTSKQLELEKYVSFISDSATKNVRLGGLPIAPTSVANIYWKKSSSEVYIDVKELPIAPADMQYQLWAIADGKPVDAGVFEITDTLVLQKMKSINLAQAFAVTLEKRGGSISPTMDAMYLMGSVVN